MTHRARVAAVLALAAATLTVAVPATAAAHGRAGRSDPVTMTVQDVSPPVPVATTRHSALTVTLNLENTSGAPLDNVSVTAERGTPIGNQGALDADLSTAGGTDHTADDGLPIKPTRPVKVDLPADSAGVQVVFRTTTSTLDDGRGVCLCLNTVYPLDFAATMTGSDGSVRTVGSATSYLPSFDQPSTPVKVAWIWPLIDRPHRLTSDTVFTDDDLADSVDQGRLSRGLAVLERMLEISPSQPRITLLVDPDLLDELEVMATTAYRYQTASGRTAAGRGREAARTWLSRFDDVIHNPGVQVALTPYADPDVQSLASAGLGWASVLPAVMTKRVSTALDGIEPITDLAWPASTRIGRATLDTLRASGTRSVVLGSKAVTPSVDADGVPASVARLGATDGAVSAALTSSAIRADVRSAVQLDGQGAAALPRLMSELAVRSIQQPHTSHLAVLTPPRYVDPSVRTAARTILDTTTSPFTRAVPLESALRSATPSSTTRLARLPASTAHLSATIIADSRGVGGGLPVVTSMLHNSTAAAPLLTGLPLAVQRIGSSAWRADSTQGGVSIGVARAQALAKQVRTIRNGVLIVPPHSNRYTLASGNSPLPITVVNHLDYPVEIAVSVQAVNGLPGFSARRVDRPIAAGAKVTLSVPTQVQRSGRIDVQAQLFTTTDEPLGPVVPLSVQSTVLGLIGVIITTVAGLVLVLALLIRFLRRVRRRRAKAGPTGTTRSAALAVAPDAST